MLVIGNGLKDNGLGLICYFPVKIIMEKMYVCMYVLKVSTLLQDLISMEHHNHNCDLTQFIFVIIFIVFHWAFMCKPIQQ